MQQPEAYIGNATNFFDAEGKFVNESTREFMKKFLLAFAAWIEATRKR
jgi:chromate reductase, NAD(P)H dehydrogenase (quinone)